MIKRDALLFALTFHVGAENGIHAKDLARGLAGPDAGPGDERQLRQVIEQLRREGYAICGTPKTGYHMAENDAELNRTCEYLYSRAMCTLTQVAAMKRVSLPDLRGQLKLPT